MCSTTISALTWLRGSIEVHDELDDMRNEYEAMKLIPKVTLKELFVNATLRIPLIIAMMIMVAQQLSGINAVSVLTCQLLQDLGVISTMKHFVLQFSLG